MLRVFDSLSLGRKHSVVEKFLRVMVHDGSNLDSHSLTRPLFTGIRPSLYPT